jgi:hypothetical protein
MGVIPEFAPANIRDPGSTQRAALGPGSELRSGRDDSQRELRGDSYDRITPPVALVTAATILPAIASIS